MRLLRFALTAVLLAATLLVGRPASAAATITLRVAPEGFVVPSHWAAGNPAVWLIDPATNGAFNDLDGIAGCTLSVNPGTDARVDGGEVLDAAAATGCISGWAAEVDPAFGRFVTMVDGTEQLGWPASWWWIQIDGMGSPTGIDDMDLVSGQSLEFVHLVGP